jgi:hypothetical protein
MFFAENNYQGSYQVRPSRASTNYKSVNRIQESRELRSQPNECRGAKKGQWFSFVEIDRIDTHGAEIDEGVTDAGERDLVNILFPEG